MHCEISTFFGTKRVGEGRKGWVDDVYISLFSFFVADRISINQCFLGIPTFPGWLVILGLQSIWEDGGVSEWVGGGFSGLFCVTKVGLCGCRERGKG